MGTLMIEDEIIKTGIKIKEGSYMKTKQDDKLKISTSGLLKIGKKKKT